jgi:two-component system LytT family response regulator
MGADKIICLIIDDKKGSRQLIRSMLEPEFPNLDLSHEASSCAEAIKINNQLKPQLVFLDVDLGDNTGFEFLELTQHKNFKLIFISAFDNYAIKAFKVNAVDYILKPFEKQELINAVQRSLNHPYYTDMKDSIRMLVESMNGQTNRLALPLSYGFEFFNIVDLIRCQSDGNYTTFYFKTGKPVTVSKTLKTYEEMLDKKGFARIHASHLINLRELKSYHRGNGGYVIMNDGSKLEVSKTKKDDFLIRLNFSQYEKI